MTDPGKYVLETRELCFSYRQVDALKDVSLALEKGELLGIIGPNGSGKTTLLRLLSGILKPRTGQILYNGKPLASYERKELAREMALVPQETSTHFAFSVQQMVMMGRYAHLGNSLFERAEDLQVASEVMQLTDTLRFADRQFNALSGGERQRVVIASALAQQPQVLLLDEPTTSLDIKYQAEIFGILSLLSTRHGYTEVIVLHDLNIAAQFCTRLIVLAGGKIVAAGAPQKVLTRDLLQEVYGTDADIFQPGSNGRLIVLPQIGRKDS